MGLALPLGLGLAIAWMDGLPGRFPDSYAQRHWDRLQAKNVGLDAALNHDVFAYVNEIAKRSGARQLRLPDYICPQGRCLPHMDGVPIDRDFGHLSTAGSAHLARKFHLFNDLKAH